MGNQVCPVVKQWIQNLDPGCLTSRSYLLIILPCFELPRIQTQLTKAMHHFIQYSLILDSLNNMNKTTKAPGRNMDFKFFYSLTISTMLQCILVITQQSFTSVLHPLNLLGFKKSQCGKASSQTTQQQDPVSKQTPREEDWYTTLLSILKPWLKSNKQGVKS